MKNVKLFTIFLSLLIITICPALSNAEGIADYLYIDKLRIDGSGKGIVYFAGPLENTPPACGQGENYKSALSFDTNTEAGKSIFNLLAAAKFAHKKFLAKGTGTCTIYSVVEDYRWGQSD